MHISFGCASLSAYSGEQQNTGISLLFPCRGYVELHISQCYLGARSVSSAQVQQLTLNFDDSYGFD